jgi:hypothetical protein
VCDDECARCSRWEPIAAAAASIPLPYVRGAILTDHVIKTTPLPTVAELSRVAVRVVLVLLALGFVAIGVTVLTAPTLVPFTVALWLCAAALLGLAVFGQFPAD